MIQNDAELIQRTLEGDQDAFGALVKKYQKGVHALAWRKIGDFHVAQEITQDAFLKAYQKLSTLKNRNAFSGWVYVIVARMSKDWLRKNRLPMDPLDTTDVSEVDQVSYSRYTAEKQAAEADETRREIVKELLKKLPESERTVITLHYLGEMTVKAVAEFLGVSQNTVKSRLSRARNRLRKEEDMIQQNLGSFQLPANLTENIMREVSRIAPAAPIANKPVLPWVLSGASAILIFLLIGTGTQYLSRFQKPYSLNATSEPTVEIIEAFFVYDAPAKPAVRNQAGSSATPGKSPGAGPQPDARLFAAALVEETEVSTPTPQWVQTKGPEGGIVNSLFTTDSGDIYAGTPTSLYKLAADSRAWKHVNSRSASSLNFQDWIVGAIQMSEHGDRLYLATDTEILASENSGETWDVLGDHPKGAPRGFVVTDAGFYLAFMENIYYSKDGKESWVSVKADLEAEKIRALAAVENTVFAGTDSGLYRLNAETWELISVGPVDEHGEKPVIHAVAASKHRLYVAAGREVTTGFGAQFKSIITGDDWWSLYRSTDFGDTWYDINPRKKTENERKPKSGFSIQFPIRSKDSTPIDFTYSSIKIITAAGRVMLADSTELFYSVNAGETWTSLDLKDRSAGVNNVAPPIVMLDANTFYRGSQSGVYRTNDAGKSWDQFNTGLAGATVMNLFALNTELYAFTMDGLAISTDGGKSWVPLSNGIDTQASKVAEFEGNLYAKGINDMTPQIHRFSTQDDKFTHIPGMPILFQKGNVVDLTALMEQESQKVLSGALKDVDKLDLEKGEVPNLEDIDLEQLDKLNDEMGKVIQEQAATAMMPLFGSFAVSDETYYMEYDQKLFRWKPGETEWYNTGLVDSAENVFATMFSKPFDYSGGISTVTNLMDSMGFKIAVSGNTVYVARRDGHLSQSFDEGDTWNDVAADLPFSMTAFNAITFAGSTVYIATDKGVAYSSDGTKWHAATDAEGGQLVMEKLAVEGTTIYGTTGQHVYQLKEKSSTWKQVTPEIPDSAFSLAVDGNMLYVGTSSSGVLRFTLDD